MIDRDFEYAAGESLDGAYLDPGSYDWFVNAFDINAALISAGAHGTFTINPLEVIPDDEHYAALAGTLLPDDPENADADLDADDCRTQILSAGNQSECDSLRNTPVLRWADKANVGSYLLYVARDKEMTNPVYDLDQNGIFTPLILTQPMWTPAAALPDSQAGTAYYYRVVPCSYQKCEALTHAEHSFDKLSRQVVLNPARQTLVGATAPADVPDGPDHEPAEPAGLPERRDLVVAGLPDDREGQHRRRHAPGVPGPHRGAKLHRPDGDRRELQLADRDHRGRPDDVHVVRHDLPRGTGLLAGPCRGRVGERAGVERDRGLRQEVARAGAGVPRRHPGGPW